MAKIPGKKKAAAKTPETGEDTVTNATPKAKRKRMVEPKFAGTDDVSTDAGDVSAKPVEFSKLAPSSTGDLIKDMLKDLVSSFYQIQKVRIQLGNKLSAHFYRKLGITAAEKMIEQQKGDRKTSVDLIDVLKVEFRRIADALSNVDVVNEKYFQELSTDERGVFDEYIEFSWMAEYRQMLFSENRVLGDIDLTLNKFPIWTDWLKKIKGVGPTIGGVIVSKINIHISDTPASIWAFAGLDVVITDRHGEPDGRGRGRFNAHLVERQYIDKQGEEQVRDSVTFDPMLKTKLVGVLGDIFIKHRTPKYRDEYDKYKARITERENGLVAKAKADGDTKYKRKADAHLNRMAIRYMIKRFLVDLYIQWRTMEGLEVVPEYSVAKLGMVHHTAQGAWATQQRQGRLGGEPDQTPASF
jgi:hypothetical protein